MNQQTETQPRPPMALVLKDNPDYVVAWACGICECVAPAWPPGTTAEESARLCCLCSSCKSAVVKRPGPGHIHRTRCSACDERASIDRRREARRSERRRFGKAEKVSERDYSGPVFCEDTERFFHGIDQLREEFEDEGEALPKYAWAAKPVTGRLDVRDWLEAAEENQELCEDYEWQAVAEFEAFVAEWNARQTTKAWHPDYRRAVLLDGGEAGE